MLMLAKEWLVWASESAAGGLIAKATLLAALGLAGAWMARRSRASLRHTLLTAVFGMLVLLPLGWLVTPPASLMVDTQQGVALPLPAPVAAPPAIQAFVGPRQIEAPPVAPVRSARFTWTQFLTAMWTAGVAAFLLPVAMGLWQIARLRRSARPWPECQMTVDRLARAAGIRRPVELLRNSLLPVPMTYGIARPVIVLPEDAAAWDEQNIERALVHELEHVRRGDWLSQCIARLMCAAYWFHPLVWVAWRQLQLEAERACDDAVLGSSESTAYAEQLVELAQRLSVSAKRPVLAMADRADLSARIGAVLDERQKRGRAGNAAIAVACATAAMLVVTVAPLEVVAAPPPIQVLEQPPSVVVVPEQAVEAAPIPAATASAETATAKAADSEPVVAPAQDQPREPEYRAETRLVMLQVMVWDSFGNNVEGLTADDFVVKEDGLTEQISVFEYQKLDEPRAEKSGTVTGYYVLGFYSPKPLDGSFHPIRVTSAKVAKLETRSGYYSGWPGGSPAAEPAPGDQSMPVLLYMKEAAYSEAARKAKYQGFVVIQVLIGTDGKVGEMHLLRSLGLGLDEQAMQAVSQWKFKPRMKDGQPVESTARAMVSFRLM